MASTATSTATAEIQDPHRLLNVTEAAIRLGMGKTKVYGLVKARRLTFVKIDDALRFRPQDLDDFITEHVRLKVVR